MSKITPKMKEIIQDRAEILALAGTSAIVLPHADIPVIIYNWAQMIIELSEEANLEIDEKSGAKIALAIAKSTAVMGIGVKTMTAVFSWAGVATFGLTTIFATATNSAANYYATQHIGHKIGNIFAEGDIKGRDIVTTLAHGLDIVDIFDAIDDSEVDDAMKKGSGNQQANDSLKNSTKGKGGPGQRYG